MQATEGADTCTHELCLAWISPADIEQDAEDRSVAGQVHQALVPSVRLELLPKSTVDVFISVLENDGVESCVAVASIAASTALADAGVEMVGLVAACAAVSLRKLRWMTVH